MALVWMVQGTAHGTDFDEMFEDEAEATAYASSVIDGDVDSTVELRRVRYSAAFDFVERVHRSSKPG